MRVIAIVLLAATAASHGCGGPTSPSDPGGSLSGGVLATFAVGADQFKVWVTNPAAVARLTALHRGEPGGRIPNGRLRRGPGRASHNAPYSWHLDPVDIEIVELAIELCDGSPSYVESNVPEYADRILRYCPWGARLVALQDLR
jgi:hypothetical protein